MRLLLILALICSALTMAGPVTAAPGGPSADCHSMDKTDGTGTGGATNEHEDAPPALHACPGCAFLGRGIPVAAQAVRAASPMQAAAVLTRPSLITSPIPPPPRIA